jgi:hypothetical protein
MDTSIQLSLVNLHWERSEHMHKCPIRSGYLINKFFFKSFKICTNKHKDAQHLSPRFNSFYSIEKIQHVWPFTSYPKKKAQVFKREGSNLIQSRQRPEERYVSLQKAHLHVLHGFLSEVCTAALQLGHLPVLLQRGVLASGDF